MNTVIDKILGPVVVYKDYIKKITDGEDTIYKQSNTPLAGYAERNVGITIFKEKVLVAVAINYNPKKNNDRTARSVIKQRLHTILKNGYDILPDDDGFTYVPVEYHNLLWQDPYAYNNLHGMIHPTYYQMAINSINAS